MKVCWIDTETTGLDPEENGLLQVAYIIEENGHIIAEDNLKIKPFEIDKIDEKALSVNHIIKEDISTFLDPYEAAKKLYFDLIKYTKSEYRDEKERLWMAGYNVKFDYDFIEWFFKKANVYQEYHSVQTKYSFLMNAVFNYHVIDVLAMVNFAKYSGFDFGKNHKLSNLCEHYNIPLDAHDAMNDIRATYQLGQIFKSRLIGG